MNKINYLFTSLIFLFSLNGLAQSWQKINIPDAFCGDGKPYSIFLKNKSNKKLIIEIMGGGACWSANTCDGMIPKTWIHKAPELSNFSYITKPKKENPWKNHAVLFIPYCTGDIHAGRTSVTYTRGSDSLIVHHTGYHNIVKTLRYLYENDLVKFHDFDDVTLFGASAGALGAMIHTQNINAYLNTQVKKTLILDSPGLIFESKVWKRFPETLWADILQSFKDAGFNLNLKTVTGASLIKDLYHYAKLNSGWNIGILQPKKDLIMSRTFGNIKAIEFEKQLNTQLNDLNQSQTEMTPNLKFWLPDSYMHTLLLLKTTSKIENDNNQSAFEFAKEIYGMRYPHIPIN